MRSLLVVSVAAGVVVASAAGCSNKTVPGPQDAGLGFDVTEMVLLKSPVDPSIFILLSDRAGLCDLLNSGYGLNNLKESNTFLLNLVNIASAVPTFGPLDAGTYPMVVDTTQSRIGFNAVGLVDFVDVGCNPTQIPATGGAVYVDALNINAGGYASGTYDVLFNLQRIQGSFDAGYCEYQLDAGVVLPDGGFVCY
jgi:hypothetical protein